MTATANEAANRIKQALDDQAAQARGPMELHGGAMIYVSRSDAQALLAALATIQASASASQEPVAIVKRGPDTPWGHGTVLVGWGNGAKDLPVGEHKVYAATRAQQIGTLRITQWPTGREWNFEPIEDLRVLPVGEHPVCIALAAIQARPASGEASGDQTIPMSNGYSLHRPAGHFQHWRLMLKGEEMRRLSRFEEEFVDAARDAPTSTPSAAKKD